MKLIVGLGNPGEKYSMSRHNMGFMAIDKICQENNVKINKKKYNGLYGTMNYKGEKIIFLKPQKYINLSGEVIRSYINFFKINITDVLVIHDDLYIPCGKLKIKYKGSSGGHNGLKNIEENLNTSEYKRIKIGISNNERINIIDYVLGNPTTEEFEQINSVLLLFPQIFLDYMENSFDNLMKKYN